MDDRRDETNERPAMRRTKRKRGTKRDEWDRVLPMRNLDPHCPHIDFDATYGFAGETMSQFREPISPCETHVLLRTDKPWG